METPSTYFKFHSTPLQHESGFYSATSAELHSLNSEERTFDIQYERHEDETPFIPKKKNFELRSEIGKIAKINFGDHESFFHDSCIGAEISMDEGFVVPQMPQAISNSYEDDEDMDIENDGSLMNHSLYDLFGPLRHAKSTPKAVTSTDTNPNTYTSTIARNCFKISSPQKREQQQKQPPPYPKRESLEGKQYVDFISRLGFEANYKPVVNKLLSYLEPKDLSVVTMVSQTWKTVCQYNNKSNKLRMEYLDGRKNRKENLILNRTPKKKFSPHRLTRNGYLTQLQSKGTFKSVNQNILPKLNSAATSPPVSPSKRKFHSYLKAAQRCSSNESLTPCPRCNLPAIVTATHGRCSRLVCQFDFCTLCRAPFHTEGSFCQIVQDERHRDVRIGSKRSKNFLRRL